MSSIDPSAEQHTYFSDVENAGEMARLLKQARLTTKGMGGPFPPSLEPTKLHNVLDLACGPGEWVLHVAQSYPHIQVTGVDISETMIQFARSISAQEPNAHFHRMDIRTPLDFPQNAFDLVNGRFLFGFLTPPAWKALLEECRRVLRPGGMLTLYEAELNLTNSLAFEQLSGCFAQALYRAGQSFSPMAVTSALR
jgi:ubiquinone/menaquinone biosynthesis C-methylase UbiE